MKNITLKIAGMTCTNCANRIEKSLRDTPGISRAAVSYKTGAADIAYDENVIAFKDIAVIIQGLGYQAGGQVKPVANVIRAAALLIILLAAYMIASHFSLGGFFSAFPTAEAGMNYGMLFVIGLLTSLHCIAMCGGINLSQCLPQGKSLRPSFLYNLGRVCSYTVVGGLVGALGSVISFSGATKGMVQLVAGAFMVVMGLNMLGFFPGLKRLMPRLPRVFTRKLDSRKNTTNSPLYIGLLNGLMPCGPLQAMQLYALSTGSVVQGALSMLLFSLGTVPLMFGLGALSSVLSGKFAQKALRAGAALVMLLGIAMFAQGWALSGSRLPLAASPAPVSSIEGVEIKDGMQIVSSTLTARAYPRITVEAGMPVKWIINAPQGSINGCNNRMLISEYDIEYQFEPGENIIEFTPSEAGTFIYSCWMGMITGKITVVEADTTR